MQMDDNSSSKVREISQLATQFRNAIEKALAAGEFNKEIVLRQFPSGCCGDASDLLGQFLLEHGWSSIYVNGTFYYEDQEFKSCTHTWLKVDGLVVDITGDQFKYCENLLFFSRPVYVGNPGEFHELFKVEDRDVYRFPGLNDYNEMASNRLSKLYSVICLYL